MNFPVTSDGITPLMLACSFGNKIIMQVIIKNKLTIKEIQDREGFNSLYYATIQGHTHIVMELGKREVPYVPSNEGTTCLHVAAKKGFLEIAEIFLKFKQMFDWKLNHPWDNKIDVHARKKSKNGLGVTAAYLSAKNGNVELFHLLHKHGADIENVKCSGGGNQDLEPIHIAVKEGNLAIVQYILGQSSNMAAIAKIRI
jgi:ankyrin repeat protein